MRFIIILILLGVIGKVLFSMGGRAYNSIESEATTKAVVARLQEKLPITFENGLRFERIEYIDHIVSMYAKEGWKKEISEERREEYKKSMVQAYCTGKMKALSQDKMRLEYVFTTQARSLNDLSTETWKVRLEPADCR